MKEKNKKRISSRGFLKTAALMGAALTVEPIVSKATKAQSILSPESSTTLNPSAASTTTTRVLGSGKAQMEVSALGLGVLGMSYNRSEHPSRKECIKLLHEAVERGVTLFDTAIIYGPLHNEELAGEALSQFRGRVAVTSKFGHEVINGKGTGRQDSSPQTIRRYCEDSLRRLRIDTIEMFYQHRYDPNTPIEEVAGTIADLVKEGKIRRWGMCEVSPEIIRRAHNAYPLTAIQSEYHFMHRDVESNGILDICKELGIGFVPYSPLNRGFLSVNMNEYTMSDCINDNRQTQPRVTVDDLSAKTSKVHELQHFGRTRGMTASQVALPCLLHQ